MSCYCILIKWFLTYHVYSSGAVLTIIVYLLYWCYLWISNTAYEILNNEEDEGTNLGQGMYKAVFGISRPFLAEKLWKNAKDNSRIKRTNVFLPPMYIQNTTSRAVTLNFTCPEAYSSF